MPVSRPEAKPGSITKVGKIGFVFPIKKNGTAVRPYRVTQIMMLPAWRSTAKRPASTR